MDLGIALLSICIIYVIIIYYANVLMCLNLGKFETKKDFLIALFPFAMWFYSILKKHNKLED